MPIYTIIDIPLLPILAWNKTGKKSKKLIFVCFSIFFVFNLFLIISALTNLIHDQIRVILDNFNPYFFLIFFFNFFVLCPTDNNWILSKYTKRGKREKDINESNFNHNKNNSIFTFETTKTNTVGEVNVKDRKNKKAKPLTSGEICRLRLH